MTMNTITKTITCKKKSISKTLKYENKVKKQKISKNEKSQGQKINKDAMTKQTLKPPKIDTFSHATCNMQQTYIPYFLELGLYPNATIAEELDDKLSSNTIASIFDDLCDIIQ